MTRRYEIVYIFDSALDDSQIDQALAKHHALLKTKTNKEPITEVNHWGKRTLAYPIGKAEVGHYTVVDARIEPESLGEFERSVKLDSQIIRYLVVLNEGEAPRPVKPPEEKDDKGDKAGEGAKKEESA